MKKLQYHNALRRLKNLLLLWSLFFLICFGLGYPTLNRYEPNQLQGLSDTSEYYLVVVGTPRRGGRGDIFSCRILVPYLAKPFYWLAQNRLKSWNSVFFGLLISNSLFCATTATLLMLIGLNVIGDVKVALLASTLYLLNFAIPNLQLVGLVDSSEAFFMIAVTWTLLKRKWPLLPLWGVLGALAKETFVPFSIVFAATWWVIAERKDGQRMRSALWVIAMALAGNLSLIISHSLLLHRLVWPWDVGVEMGGQVRYLLAFWQTISDQSLWYVFIWLLPLGIWRLKRFPRAWVLATGMTALVALLLGIYNGTMRGTVGRPLFSIAGPLLSLSVAALISEIVSSNTKSDS